MSPRKEERESFVPLFFGMIVKVFLREGRREWGRKVLGGLKII